MFFFRCALVNFSVFKLSEWVSLFIAMDLNNGPLVSEATALPIVTQPLPN